MTDCDRSPDTIGERTWLKSLVAALILGLAVTTGVAAAGNGEAGQTVTALIKGAGLTADDVGYLVVDLTDKRVLAEHNPDRPFIPASVAKIATVVPALEVLGGDYRFATTLNIVGSISDGVLTGTLILRGGGDPSLTGDDLQAMAKQLAASGIRRVDGQFLYDAGATVELPQIDAMQPEAADYNCGVSALSVNFNRVHLGWSTAAAGRSASAGAFSRHLKLPLDGIGITFAGENLPGPYVRTGPPSGDNWLLSPNLPAKGEEWLPVANPSRVTAEVFRGAAAIAGVALPAPSPGATPADARAVVRHESDRLIDIVRLAVLRYSNNLSAELIGLATSRALTGRKLSLEDSATALVDWWRKRLPDADWMGLVLGDHSGLSLKSRATPRQIVAMIEEAGGLTGGADFHDLLHQIRWKGVKGSARAKTGTMAYVRGLAGYIDTAAGHRLAFAILFNDKAKRAALDAAFDPHVVAIDAHSRRWRNRVIRLERSLTTDWAKRF